MKKITSTLLITALALSLVACSSVETPSPSENVDDMRLKTTGVTAEEAFNNLLEAYNNSDGSGHIFLGKPVEITHGEHHKGMVGEGYSVGYLFRVTDNLTGHDLPEYINLTPGHGDVFKLGNEYLVFTTHINNTLWENVHVVYSWDWKISRSSLSEQDIKKVRDIADTKRMQNQVSPAITVIENATLSQDFISSVDMVAQITITQKEGHEYSDDVFFVNFEKHEILHINDDCKHLLEFFGQESIVINSDVEIGETYFVMMTMAFGDFFLPAARNGAVVSSRSPEYEQYRAAFAELAQS